jgi:stage V sporulation protein R
MTQSDRAELERWIDIIQQKAAEYGLDCYSTHFEVAPDHVVYELGSYVLPARFSHWTFGRDYHRQKTMYEHGMSKIYEIVFNSDPCQAFLLDSNSMLAHKFVIAHVLGHNDFFKNNVYFEHTDRRMIEKVRLHANRIRKYEEEFGPLVVEEFLDAVLSIEEHFDLNLTTTYAGKTKEKAHSRRPEPRPRTEYDDLWSMGEAEGSTAEQPARHFPEEPVYDLLGFLRDHAPELEKWQRDILNMIREEMIYFMPQMRTKIINEGWASFWHERIMTNLDLTPEEHLEFRRMHAAVLSPGSKMSLNPYYVGYNILRDIERRWNGEEDEDYPEENWMGDKISRPDGEGMKKLLEVRHDECDVTLLRKYLTRGLVAKLDMYTYKLEEVNGEPMWVVQDTDWRRVRDTLIESMTNFGIPVIAVEDADYHRHGELLLRHFYDGKPLDESYTARTLKYLFQLWKRPVHVVTTMNDVETFLSFDGNDFARTPEAD